MLVSTCKNERTWKSLEGFRVEGHQRTSKDLKGVQKTRKDLKALERAQKDLKDV